MPSLGGFGIQLGVYRFGEAPWSLQCFGVGFTKSFFGADRDCAKEPSLSNLSASCPTNGLARAPQPSPRPADLCECKHSR